MSEGASRDVTYTLRLVGSPDNARTLADLIAAQKAVQAAVEKGEAAKQRAVEETAKKAKKASDDEEKAALKAFQNRLKWNEIVRNERAKAEADAARQHEQSVAKMVSAQERLKSVVASGTEGLIRMARGAAMLGVVGEKDAKKLLDALVKIQAAYDIAKGAIEFYYGLTEAVKAYRTSVLAAAAAEATLNATRRGGAATTVGGIAGAGGAAALGAAGAAAAIGVGAAAKSIYDVGSGGWRESGSWTQTIAKYEEAVASSITGLVGLGKVSFDSAKSLDEERIARINLAAMGTQAAAALKALEASARDAGRGEMARFRSDLAVRRAGGAGPDIQSRAAQLAGNELRARQREVAGQLGRNGMTYDDIDRLNQEAASLADRQASLLEQRLQLERQSADIGIRAARERIQAAERERDIATEIVARERERNLTVLERFGQMSRGEQAQLIAVREKADRFGANALSQRERQQLRSIGTSSAERLAREGDIAAANAAGGGRLFRAEDFAAEQAAQQRRVQAELVIQDQRRVEVVVEANFDALARNIQGQLTQQLDDLEVLVERMVTQKIANDQARNRDRLNQERIAAQQAR